MAIRAQSLDRALPSIAGFIADRTGIPIIRGDRAMTDNKAIYLPRRRSEIDLTERDLVESVAYLYHEAGHMLHSNFKLGATNPLQRALTGTLEDIRIEHLVMGKFPAARRYLSRLVGMVVEDGVSGTSGFPPLDGSESESAILQRYMMYRLRHEVLRQEPIAALSAGAIKVANARLPQGMLTRLAQGKLKPLKATHLLSDETQDIDTLLSFDENAPPYYGDTELQIDLGLAARELGFDRVLCLVTLDVKGKVCVCRDYDGLEVTLLEAANVQFGRFKDILGDVIQVPPPRMVQ